MCIHHLTSTVLKARQLIQIGYFFLILSDRLPTIFFVVIFEINKVKTICGYKSSEKINRLSQNQNITIYMYKYSSHIKSMAAA